ncbi:Cilia- and flagella-associated protein 73, partial [Cichlidogyrus casuarinus]
MKIETLNYRAKELEKKEIQFKEQFANFDKFIQDNDAKKARAVKKFKDDSALIEKHKETLEGLKEQFSVLS